MALDEGYELHRLGQTYLRVAEAVLSATRSPLSAREIVERGIERGLFGDHALSQTPEKSMQARLSLHIKDRQKASRFVRVARGRFLLRNDLPDPTDEMQAVEARERTLSEYIAEPRKLRLPTETVLCTPQSYYAPVLTFQGIDGDHLAVLPRLLKSTEYVNRDTAEEKNDVKQFVTYVLVQSGHRLLSYRRSYLSRAAEFLRGARCIGFGGHVSAADSDIFSRNDAGLEVCARREVSEELAIDSKVSSARAFRSMISSAPMERLGILNDDSSEVGRRHLAVVYRLWIEDWDLAKSIKKGESSLKSLNWIDLTRDKVDVTEYEYWSQLCLRRYYSSNIVSEPVVRHLSLRQFQQARIFVVAGRIGSGKTEISRYIGQRLNVPVISSGKVLQTLMHAPDIEEIGRNEFQRRAESFIREPLGPDQLGQALSRFANEAGGQRVVIDGVRQPETLSKLKTGIEMQLALLYVHTPPDIAYEMYRFRERSNSLDYSYRGFLEVFDAPVEADLSALGRLAQTYIYNFLGTDPLRRSLDRLIEDMN